MDLSFRQAMIALLVGKWWTLSKPEEITHAFRIRTIMLGDCNEQHMAVCDMGIAGSFNMSLGTITRGIIEGELQECRV